jgi:hypothetical protein
MHIRWSMLMDENHTDWRRSMACRIGALENDMVVVKTDLAVIRDNYCTKEDLAKLETRLVNAVSESERRLIFWFIATAITSLGLALGIARIL